VKSLKDIPEEYVTVIMNYCTKSDFKTDIRIAGSLWIWPSLTGILEELKSQGHIRTYNSTGTTYWIQR